MGTVKYAKQVLADERLGSRSHPDTVAAPMAEQDAAVSRPVSRVVLEFPKAAEHLFEERHVGPSPMGVVPAGLLHRHEPRLREIRHEDSGDSQRDAKVCGDFRDRLDLLAENADPIRLRRLAMRLPEVCSGADQRLDGEVVARAGAASSHGVGPNEGGGLGSAARCCLESRILSRGRRRTVCPVRIASRGRRHGYCSIRLAYPRASGTGNGLLPVSAEDTRSRIARSDPVQRAPHRARRRSVALAVIDYESIHKE